MSDNQIDGNPAEEPKQEPPNAIPSDGTKNTEGMIPRSRFNEVNERAKTLEAQMAELQAAEAKRQADSEAAKKKQLEEQNKFQELYEAAEAEKATAAEQLTALTAKTEAMTKALEAQWDSMKELVPEIFREFIEDKPVYERIEWLSKHRNELTEKEKGNGTPRRTIQRGITPPNQKQAQKSGPLFKF